MPQPLNITKARLCEVNLGDAKNRAKPINPEKTTIEVQFNPQTLKLTYTNQIESKNQKGGSSMQFVGKGTTKLSFEMWFDVTVPLPEGTGKDKTWKKLKDVRVLTEKVKFFITPNDQKGGKGKMPAVRFIWGSFIFDGIMESMNENLEFFSDDGRPLRANISVTIVSQEIFRFNNLDDSSQTVKTPGTQPLTQARTGDNIPKMTANIGQPQDWKLVAAANNIENPLRLKPGTFVNLNIDANSIENPLKSTSGASANLKAGIK